MKRVDCAIRVNNLEDMFYKLRIVIPVLKKLVTLTPKDTYVLNSTMISVINGKILTLV